jgi:hypothetical protein
MSKGRELRTLPSGSQRGLELGRAAGAADKPIQSNLFGLDVLIHLAQLIFELRLHLADNLIAEKRARSEVGGARHQGQRYEGQYQERSDE